jgi:hypothetical protein
MARTYRKLRQSLSANRRRWYREQGYLKEGHLRDGVLQYIDPSCRHHGDCPACRGSRTFFAERQAPIEDFFF